MNTLLLFSHTNLIQSFGVSFWDINLPVIVWIVKLITEYTDLGFEEHLNYYHNITKKWGWVGRGAPPHLSSSRGKRAWAVTDRQSPAMRLGLDFKKKTDSHVQMALTLKRKEACDGSNK